MPAFADATGMTVASINRFFSTRLSALIVVVFATTAIRLPFRSATFEFVRTDTARPGTKGRRLPTVTWRAPSRPWPRPIEARRKLIAKFGGAYDEPGLAGYIAAIGGRLAATTETPGLAFTFTVLDSPIVNAMALPGGYVYITRGLLALAQNEAEIAGVLGHEIGHVVARHTAQRLSQAQATQFGLIGLGILGQLYGIPSQLGRLAGTAAGLYLQGFSREQEHEADTKPTPSVSAT